MQPSSPLPSDLSSSVTQGPPALSLNVATALERLHESRLASRRSSLDLDSSSTAAPSLSHEPISISSGSSTKISSCSSVTLHCGPSPPPTRPQSPAPPAHSTARLLVIHFALGLALFLATTDVHLVATSLPTITSQLKGASTLYTWVGIAYILPQTVLQPLWGKLADIVGRKPVLYCSMALFLIGSVLCGVAQSMMWLVIARAISGAGAGGLVPTVWIITGEIVPVSDRAKWSDTLTFVWAASALAGPLLGGVFSEKVSWRWGFFINAPICVFAAILLLIFLRDELPGLDSRDWKTQLGDLNYAGLGLLVTGTTAILLGFSQASSIGWDKPSTIACLVVGVLGLVAACIQETYTKKTRFIPAGVFGKSGSILSIGSFVQTFCFTSATFYLALFFQAVSGVTAIQAGLLLLPFSLGSALISLVANFYMRRKGDPKHMVILGLGIASIGFGSMITLNEHSHRILELGLPLLAGLGMGLLFRSPFAVMERTIPEKDRAAMTACFFLVRFIGTSVGLAAAGAVFDTRIQRAIPAGFSIDTDSMDWRTLVHIVDPELRAKVLACVSSAVSLIWVVCTPLLGISCLLSFLVESENASITKAREMRRDVEKQDPQTLDEKAQVLGAPLPDSATTSTTTLPLSTTKTLGGGKLDVADVALKTPERAWSAESRV